MKKAIVNLSTNIIEYVYDDQDPSNEKYGGPWGWPEATSHVLIPSAIWADQGVRPDPHNLQAVRAQDGSFTIASMAVSAALSAVAGP